MSLAAEYLAAHLHRELAEDPRVGELGIAVEIDDVRIILAGTVPSDACHEAAIDLAREHAEGREVVSRMQVTNGPGRLSQVEEDIV